jgi:hypothetical protein
MLDNLLEQLQIILLFSITNLIIILVNFLVSLFFGDIVLFLSSNLNYLR